MRREERDGQPEDIAHRWTYIVDIVPQNGNTGHVALYLYRSGSFCF